MCCNEMKEKFEIFFANHHPTRYLSYQLIEFAPNNKTILANKLPSINLEKVLGRIKSQTEEVLRWKKYIAR